MEVPQSFVLSSELFSIFTNDPEKWADGVLIRFADDVKPEVIAIGDEIKFQNDCERLECEPKYAKKGT